KPALLLAEEQTLSAGAIEANVTGRPLVFLNACASARGEERPGESAWEATASSVVYGFLFGGAVAVVGKLCQVAARHAVALAAVLVLVLAVVAGVLHLRRTWPPQPLVVGVMEVRSRGPNVPPWMRELTRDGLNTILREFGQLRVYARQKIDFVREKRGLTEIE